MATFTLTGTLVHHDTVTPHVDEGITVLGGATPDPATHTLLLNGASAVTDADGNFAIELSAVTPYYTVRSDSRLFPDTTFESGASGETLYLDTVTVFDPMTYTPTILTQVIAARDETLAALSDASARIVNPNDVGYDVFLCIGQSNMVGYGQGLDTRYLDVPEPRVWQFAGSGTYAGQIIASGDPLFHVEQLGGRAGLLMTFARQYVSTIPENRRVLLVTCAAGGTAFTTSSVTPSPSGYHLGLGFGTWNPTGDGAGGFNLYANAVAQANAAMATNPNNRFVGILWHQGESDAGYIDQAGYSTKLDSLIDGIRSSVTGASSTTPAVVGQLLWDSLVGGGSGLLAINAAHIDTPVRKTRTALATSYAAYGLQNGDNVHFSAAGARVMGGQFYEAFKIAQANVTGVAPVAPTNLRFVQSTTSLTVRWTRPYGRATDYKIEYNTGSGWTTFAHSATPDNQATITGLSLGTTVQVRVSTINEQGTSAPSAVSSFLMAATPGQVTGLSTNGTATVGTVPIKWTAVATATGYLVEYKKHSDSTWTSFGTVTGVNTTVTGLLFNTSYDFRVSAVNGAGTGTASTTLTQSTAALGTMMDDVGVSAYRAYALRKIVTGYSGSAIRVRRSSDNTEQDIGFTGTNDLDTTALLTFCGAGDGFVKVLYDQSGNSRNLTQSTTANQAKIVSAGSLITNAGGRATMQFGNPVTYLDASPGIWNSGTSTVLTVFTPPASGSLNEVVAELSTTGSALYSMQQIASTGFYQGIATDDSGSTVLNNNNTTTSVAAALHQLSTCDTGGTYSNWVDGVAGPVYTYSRSGRTLTLNQFQIGAKKTGSYYSGKLSEIVIFAAALTTAQRQAGEANQKAYHSTP